ncbi:methyl-accepting chemotaxis sensory transducer with Cache sensor [Hydrogenophaga taeniospiralis CCUG 15921]|uniref:Methyl-accepting chemotaxis sensory transducer with Cache sensor n=1 Tax=Hydrogenophaga taeniospiralis CCUG 15921 TaxID=1281780 RepID=A0A9X4NVD2_9BURK|nr:methyl-accepting chemotaxis protein [Hydrogenophaga taeniospiralis]MDG5977967.1 methyl-accepting chemotaxis sensory transducer with Cache sensor [Hydrogenophaga taeniospiralis CCUG 15921]
MFQSTSLSVSRRLFILVASAVMGLVILLALFLTSERALIMEERQSGVRQTVETAHGLITHYHSLSAKGGLSEADAKAQALAAIRALRYSEVEYFWINDMKPVMVMHPIRPELEGKDLSENKDPEGTFLFREFVNTVKKSGAGYVSYMWPKPGSENPVQKVSYVKGFAPWGWVIGSGVYVDTVTTTIWDRTVKMGLSALALALALLGVGLLISRSIVRQLGGEPALASAITERIAQGDLSVNVPIRAGDTHSLMHSLRSMRDNMADIVSRVRQGSESVAMASTEIAQGNHDLSGRTESQASALEQTAASMEELGSTVRQNADNARQANSLAQSASSVAVQGGEVVGQVVDNMKAIHTSSQKISDIISVIDGIAFQTNILALNAAVEAARAGEQGRGFAVVAGEVRLLAGRSAEAAKEIKTLIANSVDHVEQGSALVDRARSTMQDVVQSIRQVTDIVAEISAASTEQSSAVGQVSDAVTQMDQNTQQNAAMVEQIASAASSLKSQAGDLVQTVAAFRFAPRHGLVAPVE